MDSIRYFLHLPGQYWDILLAFYHAHENLLKVAMMPFMYGFIGWLTNWQAVRMIFSPLTFWGIPPYLGWQGIIPRKSQKMASIAAQTLEKKLLKLDEVFSKLDARKICKILQESIDREVEYAVDDVLCQSNPLLWKMMPDAIRDEIISITRRQAPKAVDVIIQDIKDNIYDVFDLHKIMVDSLTGQNVKRLVMMFQRIGSKEWVFIKLSGFYFGFLLGLCQVVIWLIYPMLWTIPVQGVLVGYVTNWLAIKMVFRPTKPKRYLGFKFQGLFHRRRKEVSKEYARLVTEEILNAKNIIKMVIHGKERDNILLIIRQAIAMALIRLSSYVPVITNKTPIGFLDQIKHDISTEITSDECLAQIENYVGKTLDIEKVIIEKYNLLNDIEYENVLRDIFREDEKILIGVGAVLGGLVGFFQMWLLM
ncbi:MAG: DUF445 family protein [Syntrophaceae bacterium]|nr:DUF445 family protein [Syntrophaceae bacterium]